MKGLKKYAIRCYNSDYCCRLNVCTVHNYFYGGKLLFPEPHKKQNGRARAIRHGSLGKQKRDKKNLQAHKISAEQVEKKSEKQTNTTVNRCRL